MISDNKQLIRSIFAKNQYNLEEANKQSLGWFQQQVRLLRLQRIQPRQIIRDKGGYLRTKAFIGRMYMFIYDAETKDRLPYWDRFPLTIPFEMTDDGFIGINLHYLEYKQRVRLLQNLMTLATNKKLDDTTKLKLRYQVLISSSRYRGAKFCIKRYKLKNVKGQFKEIPAQHWGTACLLPVEQFQKAQAPQVWAESRRSR